MEFDLENPLPMPQSIDKFPPLFQVESDHMPSRGYVKSLDSERARLNARRGIVSSIFHYSRDFATFLSYLAINYMDRFLSTSSIPDEKLWIYQLVAISCISLALKMKGTEFSVSDLMKDGGFMFDSSTIKRMEMLILDALKWRMRSVTPFCFTHYFIRFFKCNDRQTTQLLKNRATDIILKAQHDIKLLEFKPSVIAASALLCAANDLCPVQFPHFRNAVCTCACVDKEEFLQCFDEMQDVATKGYEPVWAMGSSSCTPVNVLDRNCFSSSISGSQNNPLDRTRYNNGGDN